MNKPKLIQKLSNGKKRKVIYLEDVNGDITSKECTKCGKIKTLNEFTRSKGKLANRRPECKMCESLYRESRAEVKKDYDKGYRVENKSRIKQVKKRYAEENRDVLRRGYRNYYDRHREIVLKRQAIYYENNKPMFNEKANRRRAVAKGVQHSLTSSDIANIVARFDNTCALTGSTKFEIDHVIPLSVKKVGTEKGNIIPLSQRLNRSKKDKNLFEWFHENKIRLKLDENKFNDLIEWLALENNMTTSEYRNFVYKCHSKGEGEYDPA